MSSTNLILLGIGLFVSLILAVSVVEQYLVSEHDPMDPGGLIWHVKTTFSRLKDLEALLEVSESGEEDQSFRVLVRVLNDPNVALSVRYLDPDPVRDELFIIDRDLLYHYLPQEDLIVVKRWIGVPLAAVGLAYFDFSQLERDWKAGKIKLRVVQEISGFGEDLFPCPVLLSGTFSDWSATGPFFIDWEKEYQSSVDLPDFAGLEEVIRDGSNGSSTFSELFGAEDGLLTGSIRGGYVLEVRDASNAELSRMIWIDRTTFLVQKIVFFAGGRRITSVRVNRLTLDQGLTRDEILLLPRGVETIRG
jgi:hypothetical protein